MTTPFLMVAPNGAMRGKADHPALPVTIPETVETARACFQAGADALHLHIRDDQGRHTLDPGRYHEALVPLERASQLAADDPDATIEEHLGDVLQKLGRRTEAVKAWERAAALPGASEALAAKLQAAGGPAPAEAANAGAAQP